MNVLASVGHLDEMEDVSLQRPQQWREIIGEKDMSDVTQLKISKRTDATPVHQQQDPAIVTRHAIVQSGQPFPEETVVYRSVLAVTIHVILAHYYSEIRATDQ